MREIIAPTYFCQKTKERGPKVESHYHDDDAMTLSGTWCLMLRFSAVFYTICVVSSTVEMSMKVAKLCFFHKSFVFESQKQLFSYYQSHRTQNDLFLSMRELMYEDWLPKANRNHKSPESA